jgi:Ketosteroid isomerase homolog
MSVQAPRDFDIAFEKAFNAGDAAALVGLYEPEGALVSEPGSVPAVGHAALTEVAAAFFALNGRMELRTAAVIENGDLAVVYSDWSLTGTDPDGNPVEMSGRSTLALRRQPDGAWLAAIDDPWSTG